MLHHRGVSDPQLLESRGTDLAAVTLTTRGVATGVATPGQFVGDSEFHPHIDDRILRERDEGSVDCIERKVCFPPVNNIQ